MGAITAAALAADYPELVSAIILEDPPLRAAPSPPSFEFIRALKEEFGSYKDMSPQERTARARGAVQNPTWHPLEIEPWAQSKAEVHSAVLDQFGSFDRYAWRGAFERIRCPGLLITGDPDKAIVTPQVAAEVVGLWRAGEVVRLEGAGHSIHRDKYDETMAAVIAFLDRQRA
jgi:pimeloyl-ACP methyl ester carboxylesterase